MSFVDSTPRWERRYSRKVIATDLASVVFATFGAQLIRYGSSPQDLELAPARSGAITVNYTVVSLGLITGWLIALSLFDSRDRRILGIGPDEYKRVVNATFATFGTLAIIAFLLRAQIGRAYMLVALPAGLILLLLTRWLWRKRLHFQRRRESHTYRTLIVGERAKGKHVARAISRVRHAGFKLVGAVTEHGTDKDLIPGVPVLTDYDGLLPAIDTHEIDQIIMISADSLDPQRLRQIGWELETRGVDLIVAVALTDIAGPRIHTRPVSGLPLIHIEYPEFSGHKYFAKRAFDITLSLALLIGLSPLLLFLALCVRVDTPGPTIFKQMRVGLNGQDFGMLKFRTMVVGAENQISGLLDQSDGNGVLFKIRDDPRVTNVGRWMRKYSLDELPQLLNVLQGRMSLVGPRPPLPDEVKSYDEWVRRRLLVKPGITGLWQVSGRSDLSWEDSVRLDLYYVENWSMASDLAILWRTVKAVVRPNGAY